MKSLSLALAAMGLTAGAFAALPAATDPTIVNVPQLPGGFVMGGSGFYLQPSNTNGDLDYAAVNVNNATTVFGSATAFSSSLQNVDPSYNWGWGVNVGYIFPNTGNDINLSYFQLNTSDTASVFNNSLNGSISSVDNNVNFENFANGSFVPSSPNTIADSATAKSEYNLNQVDLTAGQYINVGCRLSLHPFAGLRWAEVQRKLNSAYSDDATGSTTIAGGFVTDVLNQSVAFAEKSDFQGVGPVAGIDANYYVGMGFGIVGHFDSALLIGDINASTNALTQGVAFNAVDVSEGFPAPLTFTAQGAAIASFTAGDIHRVVPVLDGKLGADYTYVFNNVANSDLTLEAGWMVSNYFNAVDRLQTNTDITLNSSTFPPVFVFSSTVTGRTTSDFAIQGPYVSLVAHI